MKKRNALLATIACLSIFAMASCASDDVSSSGGATSNNPTSENGNSADNSSVAPETTQKTLIASYSTPAELVYTNMRPTYNYYMTYYNFENLDIYDDNTYVLTYSSTMFSALVLPEEGNDATGNERDNSVQIFYGNYTSSVNALDEDSLDITLNVPNRAVVTSDSDLFVDTAQWNDTMVYNTGYETAKEYLTSIAFDTTEILASNITYSFDFFDTHPYEYIYDDDGNYVGTNSVEPEITEVSTDTEGLVGGYVSPASLVYSNNRPAYNFYTLSMCQQQILLYEDGSYEFNHFVATYSGLVLSEEGSDATGSERINYEESYYGEYTSSVNALDEDSVDITLGAPDRYKTSYNQAYWLDTANWTDDMSSMVSSDDVTYTAESYLAAVSYYSEAQILASNVTNSFDYDSSLIDSTKYLGA